MALVCRGEDAHSSFVIMDIDAKGVKDIDLVKMREQNEQKDRAAGEVKRAARCW